ncbi:MaoC/PaaZ C-terminal domain-containing protein [Desulfofundulus thermocisternus]|uniref:MaoC/PaaZ C-terminal domain-containing protein n=1 Tax=Desulfofundulus thermocisternus TaxID=42471 RepID=UPI00217DFABF|nr:MaoC/PaaZ C-terminal domain-containing protein [Desulfofundulus thermocisternus]MCS5694719.1 MaoC/PaaZ C-terminal domain-containing protein [Desulfofundulus thermocisternus]
MTSELSFFEDYEIGMKINTIGRTVTETDIVNFVCNYGFFEELFVDMEYVREKSIFKQRIAPGALIYCVAEGLSVQALARLNFAAIAFVGMENFRIPRPLYCNDTIRVEIEVVGKKETSKQDRGIIKFHHKVINQRGEIVMEYDILRMARRKVDH